MVLTTLVLALLANQARASLSPGLTCPNPDFAAMMVRINYLDFEIRACKVMVNGNEKAIEGLKTLPEDLATLKEDTETELAALGGNTTALTGRVDGLESKVDSLEVSFIPILSLEILLIILTQGNVNTLTTTLSEQTATSQSEDIELQSNIDAVQAACEAKIAELQTEFNTKLDQRDQKISQIEGQTEV